MMQKIQLDVKPERTVVRHGGSSKRIIHIILFTSKLLVNGTPPSASVANIQTMPSKMTRREVSELPCISFVRKYRAVVHNLNSSLAALRLGDADERHQLFTDGTLRFQIAFHNLVIAVMLDSKLNTVIFSWYMFLEDDTSDNQVKSIMKEVR